MYVICRYFTDCSSCTLLVSLVLWHMISINRNVTQPRDVIESWTVRGYELIQFWLIQPTWECTLDRTRTTGSYLDESNQVRRSAPRWKIGKVSSATLIGTDDDAHWCTHALTHTHKHTHTRMHKQYAYKRARKIMYEAIYEQTFTVV